MGYRDSIPLFGVTAQKMSTASSQWSNGSKRPILNCYRSREPCFASINALMAEYFDTAIEDWLPIAGYSQWALLGDGNGGIVSAKSLPRKHLHCRVNSAPPMRHMVGTQTKLDRAQCPQHHRLIQIADRPDPEHLVR